MPGIEPGQAEAGRQELNCDLNIVADNVLFEPSSLLSSTWDRKSRNWEWSWNSNPGALIWYVGILAKCLPHTIIRYNSVQASNITYEIVKTEPENIVYYEVFPTFEIYTALLIVWFMKLKRIYQKERENERAPACWLTL